MKNWLISMAVVLCSSCCDTHIEVTYEYKGTVIKRVNECGVSTFYYNEISAKSSQVSAKYSGINDGFTGYLVFGEKGKVTLLSGDGSFRSENNGTNKFNFKRISYEDVPPGKGVYYIMLATNVERERNTKTRSGVKVTYDD